MTTAGPQSIRFHLDEHVDPDIASALRRIGIDVTTTVEASVRTADDSVQWAHAQSEGRVIVTGDADFLRRAVSDSNHAGIVFYTRKARTIRQIIEGLELVHGAMTPEDPHYHPHAWRDIPHLAT